MSKRGYFVIVHDNDNENVGVCFLEDKPESRKLFQNFNNNMDYEKIQDLWNEYNENYPNMECWSGDVWPFNGYDMIEAFIVYQF